MIDFNKDSIHVKGYYGQGYWRSKYPCKARVWWIASVVHLGIFLLMAGMSGSWVATLFFIPAFWCGLSVCQAKSERSDASWVGVCEAYDGLVESHVAEKVMLRSRIQALENKLAAVAQSGEQ